MRPALLSLTVLRPAARHLKSMLMTIEAAIRAIEVTRTISGLILTPWVDSLKNVRRPALEAGMGAFFFLLLIGCRRALDGS